MPLPEHNRVLLDANVILSAAFVQDCIARKALIGLQSQGYSLCCDEVTHHESLRTLATFRLPYDPIPVFETALRDFKIVYLPPGGAEDASPIRRHDRHIPRAAAEFQASIVTDDLELYLGLIGAGYDVRNSFETNLALGSQKNGELPPRIARVPTKIQQWTLLWVRSGAWAENGRHDAKYTVFHEPNFWWIYYDASTQNWVAEFEICRKIVHAPYQLNSNQWVAIGASLDLSRTPGKVVLCIGMPSGARVYSPIGFTLAAPTMPVGISIGARYYPDHAGKRYHWSGGVSSIQKGDRFISARMWKLLCSTQNTPLHPQLNILKPALTAVSQLLPMGVRLARMSEI